MPSLYPLPGGAGTPNPRKLDVSVGLGDARRLAKPGGMLSLSVPWWHLANPLAQMCSGPSRSGGVERSCMRSTDWRSSAPWPPAASGRTRRRRPLSDRLAAAAPRPVRVQRRRRWRPPWREQSAPRAPWLPTSRSARRQGGRQARLDRGRPRQLVRRAADRADRDHRLPVRVDQAVAALEQARAGSGSRPRAATSASTSRRPRRAPGAARCSTRRARARPAARASSSGSSRRPSWTPRLRRSGSRGPLPGRASRRSATAGDPRCSARRAALARQQLADTACAAPFDGRCASGRPRAGEYLAAGAAGRDAGPHPPAAPAARGARARGRQRAVGPGRARHASRATRRVHAGRIVRLSPAIAEQNRTLAGRGRDPQPERRAPAGRVRARRDRRRADERPRDSCRRAVVTFAGHREGDHRRGRQGGGEARHHRPPRWATGSRSCGPEGRRRSSIRARQPHRRPARRRGAGR